jgi:hypothetical protein
MKSTGYKLPWPRAFIVHGWLMVSVCLYSTGHVIAGSIALVIAIAEAT